MATTTGTATDYLDLLAKLKAFATTNADLVAASQAWTLLRDASAADDILTLEGPGLAGTDEIIVTVQPYEQVANDIYNWRLGGAIGYDAAGPSWYGWSPQANDRAPLVLLRNGSMQYWFRGDGRSLSGVVKVSTVYQSFYLGLLLPYATPGQWPLPLVVGGMAMDQDLRFSEESIHHSAFWHPQKASPSLYGALLVRDAGGGWYDWANQGGGNEKRWVAPRRYTTTASLVTRNLEPMGGCYPTDALVLSMLEPAENTLGPLDAWLWTTGFGLAAEDVVQVDGQDYLAVPNGFRSATDEWALMRLG